MNPAIASVMMVTVTCYKCGIPFSFPQHFDTRRREDKQSFWCPNGHSQAFVESEADRLRNELAKKERELEFQREQRGYADKRADREERRRIALKGQLTKVKKRIQNGVCPCCKRTFQNLLRHMHSQHPGFEAQDIDGAAS